MPRRRKVPVEEQENEVADEVPVKNSKSKEKPAKKFKKEPEWMKGDGVNVAKLILSIQKSDCNNTKVIAELTRLYNKVNINRPGCLCLFLLDSILDGAQTVYGGFHEDDFDVLNS